MAISQVVWSLDTKQELEASNLIDEKELESLLSKNIEILDKSWLVINTQVRTNAGKYIDILCLDHDGDLVVVELKKDLTPREVTAQVIDYASSVSGLSAEEIAQLYLQRTNGKETLNDAYHRKYGSVLDEESVNQHVKMVIVASQMDDGTERIIHFLRETYQVDINILFFSIFKSGSERLISRAWFEDSMDVEGPTKSSEKGPWNGEYYVSFGEGKHRKWDDAKKYGFISAGGGEWYTKTMNKLNPGARIWVNIPQTGFVGVGIVTDTFKPAIHTQFEIDGEYKNISELSLSGDYLYSPDDLDNAEFIVKVNWIKTVDKNHAIKEFGFFGNQNTVCQPLSEKWVFTVNRLKQIWNID